MLQTEATPKSVMCILVFSPAWAAVADAATIFRVNLAQCLVGPAALGTPAVLSHPSARGPQVQGEPGLAGSW